MYSLLRRFNHYEEAAWKICSSSGCLLSVVNKLFELARRLTGLLECVDACALRISRDWDVTDLCTPSLE